MRMRRTTYLWAAVLALALMGASGAWADTNPANDSGAFTVRITPNVDLGVTVDTTGAAWATSADLDVVQDLGTVMLTTAAVKVTIAGNLNKQELQLTGAALNTWVLDTDGIDNTDELQLRAMFGAVPSVGNGPLTAEFDGTQNLITTTPRRAGQPQADEGDFTTNQTYELDPGADEYDDVDDMPVGAERYLWLKSVAPTTSSVDGQQAFTVTVTAVTGTGL